MHPFMALAAQGDKIAFLVQWRIRRRTSHTDRDLVMDMHRLPDLTPLANRVLLSVCVHPPLDGSGPAFFAGLVCGFRDHEK